MRNPSKVALVIAIVFLLAWVSDSEPLLAGSDSPTVRIGVLANRGSDRCLSQWAPTAQYLSEKVPDRSFQIIPVDFEQIFSVVKNSEVEFILANPSFYVELEHGFRVNRIATLRTRHTSGAYTRFAGVIFTRADRTDLHTLKELKGKQFMAVDESSMGGWHMAWRELLQNDIDPYHDFASLTFAGYHDAVVIAVLEKRVDAGTVRSDILERMAAQGLIRLDQIHVFPPPPEEAEGLPFLHSTRTYPEWPMAKVRHTDDDLAQQVAVALLQMPSDAPAAMAAESAGWGIPLNYQSVDECLRILKIGPYKNIGQITPLQVLRAFWKWILVAVVSFFFLGIATLTIVTLNRRLTVSNDRFRSVMEGLDALVYVSDMETYELLFINRYGRQTWGEVTGSICWQVLQSNQTGPCTFCTNKRLLSEDGAATGIHVWEAQNTINQRWYECRDQAIRWTDNRFVRLEVATDISERKLAQDQLLQKNQFLNHVLESLTHPFIVINADNYSIEIGNSAAGQNCPGRKCYQLTHQSEYPCSNLEHPCPLEIIKRTRQPALVEHIHYSQNGDMRNVEVHGYPIFDNNGRISQIIEYFLDITDRKRAEAALLEKEEYLRTIMATIQTGVLVSETNSGRIVDVNPFASRLIGADDKALLGQPWTRFLEEAQVGTKPVQRGADGEDGQLKTVQGKTLSIRLSKATACIREQNYTIHGFLDISDMRQLFEQQAVNIELAKGLLALVNPVLPRYCAIGDRTGLHIEAISLPCRAAGGDHFFFRHLPGNNNGAGPATFLSIKDQSGHEVNCILRSIFTDLTHNAALQNDSVSDFERTIQQLNNKLMRGGMFAEDDFLTAILAHIDHATLNMQFASCGHPPFLLIRKGHIASLPQTSGVGQNLPLGAIREIPFSAGRVRLQHGDKLLFYTDGLTEMPLEKHGWKISRQQMESLVAYLIRKKPACRVGDLMVDLLAAVAALSNQQVYPPDVNSSADDVTLIGLEMEDIDFGQTKTLQPLTTEALCADIRELSNAISGPWQAAGLVNAGQRVHIVLEEALLNAWKNGHHAKPGKPITVRWREGNDFQLEIIDNGDGFDPDLIADPTLPTNLVKSSGRGIYMIRMFADEIYWRDGGRHLTASFFRRPRPIDTNRRGPLNYMDPIWRITNMKKETDTCR
jgi:ABC-type phosphate/phosphonate transport system substrate-binding protein/PAS domain-containing protein/anti-sigma regulatory factor (Ser/Thr protein kinase)